MFEIISAEHLMTSFSTEIKLYAASLGKMMWCGLALSLPFSLFFFLVLITGILSEEIVICFK